MNSYWISGDELLLVEEMRNRIIHDAQSNGFSEIHRCYIEPGFQIHTLLSLTQNNDLFSNKKIIDIRNPQAKMDADFIAYLEAFLSNPDDNCLLIISSDKLSTAQQKTKWFELVKKKMIHKAVWPIRSNQLPQWIISRAKNMGLTLSLPVASRLAAFTEGHLLSAQQALEKLALLYENAVIDQHQLNAVLADHAQFSIFDLSEMLFASSHQNQKKIIRIVNRLQQTGEEPALVLWAICKKLREKIAFFPSAKEKLQKAAMVDEMIKGARSGDVWQAMLELCL